MIKGVQAWKQSPINKMYQGVARTAISSGRKVEEVVAESQKNGQDVLKIEEVHAIIDLNNQLKF